MTKASLYHSDMDKLHLSSRPAHYSFSHPPVDFKGDPAGVVEVKTWSVAVASILVSSEGQKASKSNVESAKEASDDAEIFQKYLGMSKGTNCRRQL